MNENAKEGHNRMIVQGYQENENRLKARIEQLERDLFDANELLSTLEENAARDEEEAEALTAQVNYWRQRTYKWMQEARKVI